MKLSLRLYRALLKLYPATFRENYAGPLEREFLDEYGEAPTRWAVARLWLRTLTDFITQVPAMLVREFSEDGRHALRQWAKRPLPIAMAIAALAIGIGANIAVFSVIDALMLRSLPFREPERLVVLQYFMPVRPESPATFEAWSRQSQYLGAAAMYLSTEVNLAGGDRPSRVAIAETSWNFFELMGTPVRAGRGFVYGEDVPGRGPVAVIGYGMWQRMFGGGPEAIGSKIYLNGEPFSVVGVAPPGFDYPNRAEIWTPNVFVRYQGVLHDPVIWRTFGRLKDGVSVRQAAAEFAAEVGRIDGSSASPNARLISLRDELAGPLRNSSLILSAAVLLLLLVACANVANLLLSRTADRAGELAIRSALGASRARLVQQLLTESFALAALGAVSSVVFANWAVRMAALFQPAGSTTIGYSLANWRVATFAAGLALATALLFGAAPAGFASGSMIRSNAPRPFTSRLRSVLVALQVGLTVVLVGGGVALGYALANAMQLDIGFDTDNLISMRVSPRGGHYDGGGKAEEEFQREVLRRVRGLEGVVAASATRFLPLGSSRFWGSYYQVEHEGPNALTDYLTVDPQFLSTMGSRIIAGRDLNESDVDASAAEQRVVVSESFARRFGDDPRAVVGRRATHDRDAELIVGVVRDLNFRGPLFEGHRNQMFAPGRPTHFVIRVKDDPRVRIPAIRHAAQLVDPQIPVYDMMTMDDRLSEVMARPRFYTVAAAMFGACAFLLAIVGLHGMISYSVTQRTRELGIRIALGTTAGALRVMLLRQGLLLVGAGAVPGLIAALLVSRWLDQLVAGATGVATVASLASLIPIAAVAALSVWSATSRIANLDPSAALRSE